MALFFGAQDKGGRFLSCGRYVVRMEFLLVLSHLESYPVGMHEDLGQLSSDGY